MNRAGLTIVGALIGVAAALLPELRRLPPMQVVHADAYGPTAPAAPRLTAPEPRPAGTSAVSVDTPTAASSLRPTPARLWLDSRLAYHADSAHYVVLTDISADLATELVAFLEPYFDTFRARFGVEPRSIDPTGRLPLFLYSSRAVYQHGPPARDEPWPDGREGFCRGGAAHVEFSDDVDALRAVMVHEAAHQFHFLSLGAGGPMWYTEGVAHDLAWELERRDLQARARAPYEWVPPAPGQDLVLGFYDAMERGVDLSALLAGRACSLDDEMQRRGIGLVFVRYLRGAYPEWFGRFERAVAAGGAPPEWSGVSDLGVELLEFAKTLRPPLKVSANLSFASGATWSRSVERDRLYVPVMALPPRGESASLSFRLPPLNPGEQVGFGFGASDDVRVVARVDPQGSALTVERVAAGGGLERLFQVEARARVRSLELQLKVSETGEVSFLRSGIGLYRGTPKLSECDTIGVYMQASRRSPFGPEFRFYQLAIDGRVLEELQSVEDEGSTAR